MSGNVGSSGRGFLVAFLVVGAIAAGIGVATYLKSGPSETTEQAQVTANQPATISAPEQQAAPAQIGTVENGTAQAQEGAVALIATDDPSYLGCIEEPLRSGETRDQRVAFCNQQLNAQQQPSPRP